MTADKMPDYIFAWRDETPNKRPRWSPIIPGPKAELWEKYIRADIPDPRLEILAAALRFVIDLSNEELPYASVGSGAEIVLRNSIRKARQALKDTGMVG